MVVSDADLKSCELLVSRARWADDLIQAKVDKFKKNSALYDALNYVLFPGGKRIRPALTILGTEAVKGNIEQTLPAAAAYEFLHNFTVVHDDIISENEIRRDQPSLHMKYGKDVALLAGDMLFSLSHDSLHDLAKIHSVPSKVLTTFSYFNTTCKNLAEGKFREMELEKKDNPTVPDYYEMVDVKTGDMFVGPLKTGALLGNANEDQLSAIEAYAYALGRTYQIREDLISLNQGAHSIRNGTRALYTVYALSKLNKDKDAFLEILNKPAEKISAGDIEEVFDLMDRVKAVRFAETEMKRYVEIGKKKLRTLPDTKAKECLENVIDFAHLREK
ncbi:MAG: polyprenyl synthetase family protein [Candidatus Diapherotrites archaeon]|nr:polyprenyl synthetase family protein [Candidatus Diapherotrites archaeon]